MDLCFPATVSAVSSIQNHALPRRSANFHPSIWGDYFLAYASEEPFTQEEVELERLKEEVRKMLNETPDKSSRKLDLIDSIQRLGVSYHFRAEIEASLMHIYNADDDCNVDDGNDPYTIALRFRLLRQQGHYVSSDIFNKFKNADGKFKESLVGDVRGMLSLYEAANFLVHGEDILEDALRFTTTHLKFMAHNLRGLIAKQVDQALNLPIQKTLTRLGARQYMSLYQEDESLDEILLKFSKLDFHRLQRMHQKELSEITKWWKGLDFARKLPFARDRLVECYFWILGVYFEPQYRLTRKMLTKVIAMVSTIDDIYDVYGTLDELILFTDAIERWDTNALNQLPSYMRHFYQALLDVYDEMEEQLAKKDKSYQFNYAKGEMKKLVRAYYQEAYWFHSGYTPTTEEYMKVALVSSAYTKLATTSLVGMGELVTKETFDWVINEPLIVRAASVITRLTDDIVGHEFEQKRGHVASAVECYMNQYGASKDEAVGELQKQVTNAWKDINKECLYPTAAAMPILERVLNLARVISLLYKDEDGYTHSTTKAKNYITSVLVDPVTL